jgi:hypothetical protein
MPPRMVALFRGGHFWKMPQDVEVNVGRWSVIRFRAFTSMRREKQQPGTEGVHLPDGNYDISNYAGGERFSTPQEPDKGYKLLTDLWFDYGPYPSVGASGNSLHTALRTSSVACSARPWCLPAVGLHADPRVSQQDPKAPNLRFSE